MTAVYSAVLIERLHQDFKKGKSLSDLAKIYNRTEYGILQEFGKLSKAYPDKWDASKVTKYQGEYYEKLKEIKKRKIAKYYEEYRKQHKKEILKNRRKLMIKHPDYMENWRKQHPDYMKEWKKKHLDYNKKLREKRKKERAYIVFGDFLIEKLIMMDKNPQWLADRLKKSRQTIYSYLNGLSCPDNKKVKRKICEIFEIKTKNLEEMLEIAS